MTQIDPEEPSGKRAQEEFSTAASMEDAAQEEKDYRTFQEENSEEHAEWQKNLKEITNAMQEKRDALLEVVASMREKRDAKISDVDHIRILIMVLGGAIQGSYGAGQMSALQEMGYASQHLNGHDTFLGISAGSSTCAFGMAGMKQALLGTSYFYTICAKTEFINFIRLHQMVDVSVIERALRNDPTKLDTQAVMKNPAKFFVQAYNETKKEPELINAKDPAIDMIDAIHASMAIPVMYHKAIHIDGSYYTDGAFDDPLPITRAIEKFDPTHVLILPNMPFNRISAGEPSRTQKMIANAMPRSGTLGFVRKILKSRQSLRQSLDTIAKTARVKIGVAWPPEMGLRALTQDAPQIKAAIREAAKSMFALFGESDRDLKLYEEEYPA